MLKSYDINANIVQLEPCFPAVSFVYFFRSFETSWLVILVFTRRIPFPFSSLFSCSVYQTKSVPSRSKVVLKVFQSRSLSVPNSSVLNKECRSNLDTVP